MELEDEVELGLEYLHEHMELKWQGSWSWLEDSWVKNTATPIIHIFAWTHNHRNVVEVFSGVHLGTSNLYDRSRPRDGGWSLSRIKTHGFQFKNSWYVRCSPWIHLRPVLFVMFKMIWLAPVSICLVSTCFAFFILGHNYKEWFTRSRVEHPPFLTSGG